jgi:hypothetical protein
VNRGTYGITPETRARGRMIFPSDPQYCTPTVDVPLTRGDKGKILAISATQTQTIGGRLAKGWWCEVWNTATDGVQVVTVQPKGEQTIDGLASLTMYAGERRVILSDGKNLYSRLLQGGFARFTADGSFIVPRHREGDRGLHRRWWWWWWGTGWCGSLQP